MHATEAAKLVGAVVELAKGGQAGSAMEATLARARAETAARCVTRFIRFSANKRKNPGAAAGLGAAGSVFLLDSSSSNKALPSVAEFFAEIGLEQFTEVVVEELADTLADLLDAAKSDAEQFELDLKVRACQYLLPCCPAALLP